MSKNTFINNCYILFASKLRWVKVWKKSDQKYIHTTIIIRYWLYDNAMFYDWLQSLLVAFSGLYRIAHTYMYQSFVMFCAVSVCGRQSTWDMTGETLIRLHRLLKISCQGYKCLILQVNPFMSTLGNFWKSFKKISVGLGYKKSERLS